MFDFHRFMLYNLFFYLQSNVFSKTLLLQKAFQNYVLFLRLSSKIGRLFSVFHV